MSRLKLFLLMSDLDTGRLDHQRGDLELPVFAGSGQAPERGGDEPILSNLVAWEARSANLLSLHLTIIDI